MQSLNSLSPEELKSKRVLFRVDYNVPMQDGVIQDDTRIVKSLSSLRFMMESGARVIVMTHLGRPKGEVVDELRVDALAKHLSQYLGIEVKKLNESVGESVEAEVNTMQDSQVLMLENLRFNPGEKKNSDEFIDALAKLGDLYVSDAFGACHRAHASTYGIAKVLPAHAGFLLAREVRVLKGLMDSPKAPFGLVVGGAKIDTKIGILEQFLEKADHFFIGGAMANTFLAAQGFDMAESLVQNDKLELAKDFISRVEALGKTLHLPTDLVVADEISPDAHAEVKSIDELTGANKALDIGPASTESYVKHIQECETVIWNGPMGLYELPQFENGSKALATTLSQSSCTSVIGGGDSIDAINKFELDHDSFSHISTGGGAMLEFLEGKNLPGIEVFQ